MMPNIKPLKERSLWPSDWPDVICPKCEENTPMGLFNLSGEILGCICFRCRRTFEAIWDDKKEAWESTIKSREDITDEWVYSKVEEYSK